ncbi:MAG: hypothetical protein IJF78_07890 [Clostridia bacterium]|nr:hypothetical protein [Clostridia bacterium]
MTKNRLFCLLSALLILLNSTACSTGTTDETLAANTTSSEHIVETTQEESAPERVAGPAQTDLEGYNFRIITSVWYDNNKIIYPEELNGESVNDAVYNANLSLMDDYNCVLTPIVMENEGVVTSSVSASVSASLDEYDMSFNHDNRTVDNVLKGDFLNLRMSDVFNFDAPWWTKTADNFTIGNGMYFAANYATYSPMYFGFVLTYNKDLAEDYHIEIPYDDIFAGNWYLDDMIAMTTDVNRDLDGDGKMTVGKDQYGFMASALGLVNFQVSMGITMLEKDADNYLVFNPDQERLSVLFGKFEKLMENGINKDVDGQWGYGTKYFAQGQALFCLPQILDIPAIMPESDVRFGTLPMPKLDELQKDYISGAFDVYWGIPKTAYANLDTNATIIEVMGHNCVYDVLPLAYESALQVRFADSPIDAKAYEIIRDSMCVDIGYTLNERCGGLNEAVRALTRMEAGTMASAFQKNSKLLNKSLSKINDTFREMNALEYGGETTAPAE